VEILVGALVVLGFLAILARFVTRDASGEIRLPRVVDDSIGMWTLRRITGRRLGERAWDDELDGELQLDPNASEPTRAALGAIAAASAAGAANVVSASRPAFAPAASAVAPSPVAPVARPGAAASIARPAYVAQRRRTKGRPVRAGSMISPTPVLDLRRRQEASARRRPSPWPRRIAAFATIAAMVIVAVVAIVGLGALQAGVPQGQVLAATGRPQLSPSASQLAIAVSGVAPSDEPTDATESSGAAPTATPAATSKAIATPRPTIRPTPAPTPAPTRKPSPKPTAQPTPSLPPAPLVSFSFDVSGAIVTFTNTSTGADPTWFWNFHDGSTSLAMSPVHEFLASGTYVVELTMTDAYDRTDSDSQAVAVTIP
jgi:hypothetical protein